MAHGSGSTAAFVRRAFDAALAAWGIDLAPVEDRTGSIDHVVAGLEAEVDRQLAAGRAVLVGGISLGAHAAAIVAARRPQLAGALLALPAWDGSPGAVAALSATSAGQLETRGVGATVDQLATEGWVGAALAYAWPTYSPEGLVAALRATAQSAGPTLGELAMIQSPTGLFALPDDPFHPADVALRWARLIPGARLRRIAINDQDQAGPCLLGHHTVAAWLEAAWMARPLT